VICSARCQVTALVLLVKWKTTAVQLFVQLAQAYTLVCSMSTRRACNVAVLRQLLKSRLVAVTV
jgi:hypothetical protein